MRRSATSVWKDARANIEGLPDLPADLTEPQYASLAFDPFCHVRRLSHLVVLRTNGDCCPALWCTQRSNYLMGLSGPKLPEMHQLQVNHHPVAFSRSILQACLSFSLGSRMQRICTAEFQ